MPTKRKFVRILFCLSLFALAIPALAHHVFSAEYDADKPVRLQGTLTKVGWVNPHSWIYVDVKDASGKTTNWTIEFGSPGQVTRRGLKKADLTIGSVLDISGYLHKNKEAVAIASTVKMPDGREFYVGAEGTGAPEPKPIGSDKPAGE